MVASSSGLLAIDTLGSSSIETERSVSVDVVDDSEAYLSLIEDNDGTSGLLFEDGRPREPPVTFHLENKLTEKVKISKLESKHGEFDIVPDETNLDPGEDAGVTVERTNKNDLGSVDDTIEIVAEGDSTRIEADRSLTLAPESESFEFTLSKGEGKQAEVILDVREADTGFEVELNVESDDDITAGQKDINIEPAEVVTIGPDETETFELENISPGNWVAENLDATEDAGPGDEVTVERTLGGQQIEVTLDTDGAGKNEQVSVTIDISS